MRKFFPCFILFLLVALLPAQAFAGAAGETIKLEAGAGYANIDGSYKELRAAPYIDKGVTMVPLYLFAELAGAELSFNSNTREAVLRNDDTVMSFRVGSKRVFVNGKEIACDAAPCINDGTLFVPLKAICEGFHYQVSFVPGTKEIYIKKALRNHPPVADFTLGQDVVAQGETVIYEDQSYDPDGDELVERKWTGKERAFFAPGEYKVSLQVKDSRGAWSEPCTRVIRVTEEVKLDKFNYYLRHPVPGEVLGAEELPVLGFKLVEPAVTVNREKIMISNSPEKITGEGILYRDVLEGENRIFYHHLNAAGETMRVFLLAQNRGQEPVRLTVQKSGVAGPADPLAVGRAAAYRFLDFQPGESRFLKLAPGEMAVLNEGQGSIVPPGKAVNGIFDVNARDELLFAVVAVISREKLPGWERLPVLPRDGVHLRGTFERSRRNLLVRVRGEEPSRLVVADGNSDSFLYGKDQRLVQKNKGNYGLSYRVTIKSKQRVAVLFSPRGGAFAGAGTWDGKAFYLPNKGVLKPQAECAVIGVVKPGEEKVLEFIPPAGSSLPVNLLFINVPGSNLLTK